MNEEDLCNRDNIRKRTETMKTFIDLIIFILCNDECSVKQNVQLETSHIIYLGYIFTELADDILFWLIKKYILFFFNDCLKKTENRLFSFK